MYFLISVEDRSYLWISCRRSCTYQQLSPTVTRITSTRSFTLPSTTLTSWFGLQRLWTSHTWANSLHCTYTYFMQHVIMMEVLCKFNNFCLIFMFKSSLLQNLRPELPKIVIFAIFCLFTSKVKSLSRCYGVTESKRSQLYQNQNWDYCTPVGSEWWTYNFDIKTLIKDLWYKVSLNFKLFEVHITRFRHIQYTVLLMNFLL